MSGNGCEFTLEVTRDDICEILGFSSYREALSMWKVLLPRALRASADVTADLYDFEGRLLFSSHGPVDGDEPLRNLLPPGPYALVWFGPKNAPDYRLVPIPRGAGGENPQSLPAASRDVAAQVRGSAG